MLVYECRHVAGKGCIGQFSRTCNRLGSADPPRSPSRSLRLPSAHFDSEHLCDFAAPIGPPLTALAVAAGSPNALGLALWIAGDFLDRRNVARPGRYDGHVSAVAVLQRQRTGRGPQVDVSPMAESMAPIGCTFIETAPDGEHPQPESRSPRAVVSQSVSRRCGRSWYLIGLQPCAASATGSRQE